MELNQNLENTSDNGMHSKTQLEPIIIDLDGSIVAQTDFTSRYSPRVFPAREHDAALRYWATCDDLDEFGSKFVKEMGPIEGKAIFYGSSDSHNLTWELLKLLEKPVTVIHFDAHNDFSKMGIPDTSIGAGTWVGRALELPNVKKVIQFGLDKDLGWVGGAPIPLGSYSHEIDLITSNKVDCYPNNCISTTLFGDIKNSNPTVEMDNHMFMTDVKWISFKGNGGADAVVTRAMERVPTNDVYITIDKDALREQDAVTNYHGFLQGAMTLEDMVTALKVIAKHKNIIAMDVCGDGSTSTCRDWSIKDIFRRVKDHSLEEGFFERPENVAINASTNIKILEAISIRK
jgi:Arginase family